MHDYLFEHDHQVDAHTFGHCCLNCAESLATLKQLLTSFHRQIAHHTRESLAQLSPDELFRLFLMLDDISHLEGGDRLGQLVDSDPEIHGMLPSIRSYYEHFFSLHENHLAEAILRDPEPWQALAGFALFPRYEGLIRNERSLATEPSDGRPLAFVGCGAVPVSLFLHTRQSDRRAIGIELDSQAASLARRCVDRLGLGDRIEIVVGDERRLATLDFGSVLVAALAEPKARIFATLRSLLEARPSVSVFYRTYTGLRTLLHAPVRPQDIAGFHIVGEVAASGRINNTSVRIRLAPP